MSIQFKSYWKCARTSVLVALVAYSVGGVEARAEGGGCFASQGQANVNAVTSCADYGFRVTAVKNNTYRGCSRDNRNRPTYYYDFVCSGPRDLTSSEVRSPSTAGESACISIRDPQIDEKLASFCPNGSPRKRNCEIRIGNTAQRGKKVIQCVGSAGSGTTDNAVAKYNDDAHSKSKAAINGMSNTPDDGVAKHNDSSHNKSKAAINGISNTPDDGVAKYNDASHDKAKSAINGISNTPDDGVTKYNDASHNKSKSAIAGMSNTPDDGVAKNNDSSHEKSKTARGSIAGSSESKSSAGGGFKLTEADGDGQPAAPSTQGNLSAPPMVTAEGGSDPRDWNQPYASESAGPSSTKMDSGAVVHQDGDGNVTSVTGAKLNQSERIDRSGIADSSDADCKVSAGISGEFACGATRTTIETAKVTNMLSQTVGSVATAAMGQAAQAKAQAEGTQSAAMTAAASTQRASGGMQIATGSVNALMGAVQLYQSYSHKKTAGRLNDETKAVKLSNANAGSGAGNGQGVSDDGYLSATAGSVADKIMSHNGSDLNVDSTIQLTQLSGNQSTRQAELANRNAEIKLKENQFKRHIAGVGSDASGEQTKMSKEAMAAGMMSVITGASQLTSGGFNVAAADEMDKAAKNMRGIEGKINAMAGFQPMGVGDVSPGDALAPRDATTITGNGATPDAAAAEDTTEIKDDFGGLGRPIGMAPIDNLKSAGPEAGRFNSKDTPPAAGGGGGGLGGGGSTSAASGENAEAQARMADPARAGYDSAGGGMMTGGGGGGGGAKEPDLSGLLAQFLPKKEDEQKNPNGILDFGGRSPSSEGPISLLDKNANIFDRIHETYQDKNRRGNIGM